MLIINVYSLFDLFLETCQDSRGSVNEMLFKNKGTGQNRQEKAV